MVGRTDFRNPINRQRAKWWDSVFWVNLLLIVTIAFAVLPSGLSWEFELRESLADGSLVRKFQWSSVFLLAFILAWKIRFQYFKEFFLGNIFVWSVAFYALLSVFWSAVPWSAFRQVVQLMGILLISYVLAVYSRNDTGRIFALALDVLVCVLLASVLMVMIDPVQGRERLMGIEGAWRGVLEQKNVLGMTSGVALLLLLYGQSAKPRSVWVFLGYLLIILSCLLGSRSSSSLFFSVVSIGIYVSLFRHYVQSAAFFVRMFLLLLLLLILCLMVFYYFNDRFLGVGDVLGPISEIFGKSSDLTGRSDIWELMWESIERHWVLGMGFTSFWLGPGGPSQYISDVLQWTVPNAHNGYLEILNEMGVLGLILYFFAIAFHMRNIFRLYAVDRCQSAFHFALLIAFLISNFSESTAMRVTTFLQILIFVSMMIAQMSCMKPSASARSLNETRVS